MIAHLSPIIEGIVGGVGSIVVWESIKAVGRMCKRDSEESRVSRLLKQQSDLLKEVQQERTECTEKREKAEARIGSLEARNDTLEADVEELKGKIEKQAHDYQNELKLANEAGRLAMVSAQGNDDGRRLAETRLAELHLKFAELTTQLNAANDYALRLRAEIHVLDPEHAEARNDTVNPTVK